MGARQEDSLRMDEKLTETPLFSLVRSPTGSLAVHCELKPNRPATKYADLRITVPICYTLCRFCRINKDAGSSNGTSNVNSTYVRADSLMAAMKAEIREHNETLRRGSEVYEITGQSRGRPSLLLRTRAALS